MCRSRRISTRCAARWRIGPDVLPDVPVNPLVVGGLAFAGTLLVGWLLWIWWKRRHRSSIKDAIASIAIERLEDVLVPDGMGGEIHIEHLLLTARGILVVNVKRYDGAIFASERMDQWTAIGSEGRSTFQNPLANLYDRVAAVRELVREIEVAGLLVFPSQADFSKGRPKDVMLPEDLVRTYAKPDAANVGQMTEAFEPHWDRIRSAVRPASP